MGMTNHFSNYIYGPLHEMEFGTAKVSKDLRQKVIDPREKTTTIILVNEHRNNLTLNAI